MTESLEFQINGMTCGGCSNRVKKVLEQNLINNNNTINDTKVAVVLDFSIINLVFIINIRCNKIINTNNKIIIIITEIEVLEVKPTQIIIMLSFLVIIITKITITMEE